MYKLLHEGVGILSNSYYNTAYLDAYGDLYFGANEYLKVATKQIVDKSALAGEITAANTLYVTNPDRYPAAARTALRSAIDAAEALHADPNTLQARVNGERERLTAAILAYEAAELGSSVPPGNPPLTTGTEQPLAEDEEGGEEPEAGAEEEAAEEQTGNPGNPGNPGPGSQPAVPGLLLDTAGHWAADDIQEALRLQFIQGYPDQNFKPDRAVTRAEFVAMLVRLIQPAAQESVDDAAWTEPKGFADQALIGAWAAPSIAQAVEHGWLNGYADGSFRPNRPLGRVEMAVIIASVLGLSAGQVEATGFADDAAIPAWGKASIEALRQASLVLGRGGGRYGADADLTRAEAVVLLLRVHKRQGGNE